MTLKPLPQADHRQRQCKQQKRPVEVLLLQPVHAQQRGHGQKQRKANAVQHTNRGNDNGAGIDAVETLHVGRLACWQQDGRRFPLAASYNITRRWATTVLSLALIISTALTTAGAAASSSLPRAADAGITSRISSDPGCSALRSEIDTRIEREQVADPRHARIQLSPWLRSDRFLADALARQVSSGGPTRPILEAMANHDEAALAREIGRLGMPAVDDVTEALNDCRRRAIEELLSGPDPSQRLTEVGVPDAYRDWQRRLGAYPLARPWLRMGAQRWRLGEHRLQREQEPPKAVIRWRGPATAQAPTQGDVAAWLAQARAMHALNWPLPQAQHLEQMAILHAPILEISSTATADRIGRLLGHRNRPKVDTDTPSAYFEAGFTRFGERVLLQLSYTFWFPERVASHFLDPYAGAIDGLVWRVTLDDDGQPLLWESIHACGCYYTLVLPADARLRFHNPDAAAREDPLVLIGPSADHRIRFSVSTGEHFLRWPRSADESRAEQGVENRSYVLRAYAELLEPGSQRPPFGSDGLLAGTSRLERFFLWPAGIPDPGAMRSNGHHATAFLGRRHFDDAQLASGMVEAIPVNHGDR